MKQFHRAIALFTMSLLAFGAVSGCAKNESGIPSNIDVSANIEKLKSSEPNERIEGAANLGMAGPKAEPAIPHLMPLLKDPNADVRRLAAFALGEIGPPASKALPELRAMMRDPDRDVIFQAANAIRSIDPEAPLAP
jgi:HEAT repeat protein